MGIRIEVRANPQVSFRRVAEASFGLAAMLLAGMLLVGGCPGLAAAQEHVEAGGNSDTKSGAFGGAASNWALTAGLGGRGAAPRAAARSLNGERAVADENGVTWWRGPLRERAQIDDVRDVAFDSEGRLWVGAGSGLYAWALPGRPVRRALRGGESANRIRRLALQGQSLLVASERGAFWSTSGRIFQPLEGVAANDDYALAAFRVQSLLGRDGGISVPHVEAWLFGLRGLVRIRGMMTPSGLRVVGMERASLPRPTREGSAMDLSIDRDGGTLWVAYADALASRTLSASDALAENPERWIGLRPVLPPGAVIRRLAVGPEKMFLASDRGVLEADRGETVFRRVASSAGTSDCVDVREVKQVVIALCREGVFERGAERPGGMANSLGADRVGGPSPTRVPSGVSGAGAKILGAAVDPSQGASADGSAATASVQTLPKDPPLSEIRRRALERSGLSVSRAEAMRRGLARRAFLPEVAFRVGAAVDRDRAHDADQAFISGDTRFLVDRSRDEGLSLDATLEFEWDFGGAAFPDDSVDLSRELRQVVSLRDDIADEINQLYFERQRIRSRLARAELRTREEMSALYWRAREIDAGLDAWTGGWIADWRRARRARESADQENHPVQERGKSQ